MNVAVIPARGGSKRIPRKNILPFCGKPMIAYSIDAALESGVFERVIVSTDDAEITDIARQLGAEVPFARPAALSDDHTVTVDVVAHALEELGRQGWTPKFTCCIYATAPFISPADLRSGFELISVSEFDYVLPTTTFAYPIFRALKPSEGRDLDMYFPEYVHTRSQDLPEALHDVGQFYWGRSQAWMHRKPILTGRSATIRIPRTRAQDIDTLEDWHFAELLYRARLTWEHKV